VCSSDLRRGSIRSRRGRRGGRERRVRGRGKGGGGGGYQKKVKQ